MIKRDRRLDSGSLEKIIGLESVLGFAGILSNRGLIFLFFFLSFFLCFLVRC